MTLRDYYKSLTYQQQADFARRAGTTRGYIETHYLSVPPRKVPRKPNFECLVLATEGAVSRYEMFDHFYPAWPVA